jgi:hypothetical protein
VKRSVIAVAGSIALGLTLTSAGLAESAPAVAANAARPAAAAAGSVGTLAIVNPASDAVTEKHIKGFPEQILVPRSGSTAFVTAFANGGGQVAYKVTPGQSVQVRKIAESRSAIAVSINPDGRTVYLSEPETPLQGQPHAKIVPVSATTGKSGRPIYVRGLGWQVPTMSVEPNTKIMYVAATEHATVEAIRLSTRKVIGRPIRLTSRASGFFGAPQLTYSRSGSRLYVLYSLGSTRHSWLTVINTKTGRKVGTVRLLGFVTVNSEDLAVAPDGTFAYVVSELPRTGETVCYLSVVHIGAKVSTVRRVSIGGADAIAEASSGRSAYVAGADYGANEVGQLTAIPTATNEPSSPLTVAEDTPTWVSISPDSSTAYVEEVNDMVYPVNLTTNVVEPAIPVGPPPVNFPGDGGMAITHNGGILYVLGAITE